MDTEHPLPSPSSDVVKAVKFEVSNRAHGSVYEDPFYRVTPEMADAKPGTLLKVEDYTQTSFYTIPPSLSLSRFIYQSMRSDGSYVPVSGYVLWPYTAASCGDGDGIPVVAWSHGTSGTSAQCAPSNIRNLWHHFQVPFELALAGYVVVATDYAGLGVHTNARGQPIKHHYLASHILANDVIYSVPAARQAFPQLSRNFVVIGSSLGGGSAWAVAERMAAEPVAGYQGTIALSPMTSVLVEAESRHYTSTAYLLVMMIPGIEDLFPNFDRAAVLQAEGLQTLKTYSDVEGGNSVLSHLNTDLHVLKQGWQDDLHIQQWQKENSVGGKAIKGPLLVLQGEYDPVTTTSVVTNAVQKTAAQCPSEHIDHRVLGNVTHGPVMHAGRQIYVNWIAERFAQKQLEPGLQSSIVTPLRPIAQPETNFYLMRQNELWQAT
ncbi:hypothetical protein MMC10_000576 [Thelotrema lepadinum]|nr:hypothetical protein [Thelotrema lepadinum]